MKPTDKQLNDRLRELFGRLPFRAREVRKLLRAGGIYAVQRYHVGFVLYACGNEIAPPKLNSAVELINEQGKAVKEMFIDLDKKKLIE